jgi:hypothetical protein
MKSVEIRLLETAKEDLREGYWFYEEQSSGLGDYFLDCMQADVKTRLNEPVDRYRYRPFWRLMPCIPVLSSSWWLS